MPEKSAESVRFFTVPSHRHREILETVREFLCRAYVPERGIRLRTAQTDFTTARCARKTSLSSASERLR